MDRNIIREQTDQWWYSHQRQIQAAVEAYNEGNTGDLRALMNHHFESGGRWAVRETAILNPHISKFVEMLILLGVFDDKLAIQEGEGESGDSGFYPQGDLFGVPEGVSVRSKLPRSDEADMQSLRVEDRLA